MLPCSLWAESIFSVFRSLHLPLDTQFWSRGFPLVMRSWKADLPLATRARKRELCLYRYVSRMTRTGNFITQFFFVVFFSGNHFSPRFMLPCSLWAKNVFLVFRSLHVPLDTQFWTRGFPLVMRSRKADLPLATRARKRELCLYRYVSRMTRTENFISQFFFVVFFLETTFLHVSCYPVHCEPKTYFWFFEFCTYPSIHNFGLEASPL